MQNKFFLAYNATRVLIGFVAMTAFGLSPMAIAQQRQPALEEVLVTAQKREESLQDVPVAVTALLQESIEVNAVVNVNDLNGLAPNVTVRPAIGGANIPSFNIRGRTSFGVVGGVDTPVSIYLDGVYIGSSSGTIFTLPDIQRIEVLRGPQGALFGRNATAGAINITTRDPSGDWGFRQKVTSGSRDMFGTQTSLDLPAFGPLSMYASYTQQEQDGAIDNEGAGTVWDRTAFGMGFDESPDTLGATDTESFFLAAKFEPTTTIGLIYKYDYSTDKSSPRGTGFHTEVFTGALSPEGALVIDTIVDENAEKINPTQTRPDKVDNPFHVARDQTVQGHSLVLKWALGENLFLKNTMGYRKAEVLAITDLTETSGWTTGVRSSLILRVPPGTPFCFVCNQTDNLSEQWSNEVQVNYSLDFVDITTGAIYYRQDDDTGSPENSANTFIFATFPDHEIPAGNQARSFNELESYAAYAHGEFHVLNNLDVDVGLRYTVDNKSGEFVTGSPGNFESIGFDIEDDNFSFVFGTNYRLTDQMMVYAKYSKSFVSGGAVGPFEFDPEVATSLETGYKGDFLGSRLRANLAVYDVEYENIQESKAGSSVPGGERFGVLIIDAGTLRSQGAELEVTAMPLSGLTLSATLGYQDNWWAKTTPLFEASFQIPEFGGKLEPRLSPEWNGKLAAFYETAPLLGKATLNFGLSGIWSDKIRLEANPARADQTPFGAAEFTPEHWKLNARASLKNLSFGSGWKGELGLWGRNLTDADHLEFSTNFGAFAAGTFMQERSFGVDFVVNY